MASYQRTKAYLVELISKNECIYNPKDKNYRNKPVKTMLWDDIAGKLNIDSSKAREMWRSLRDGYIRHKKALKLKGPKASQYYSWADKLSFLDIAIEGSKDIEFVDEFPPQQSCAQNSFFSEEVYSKINLDSPTQQVDLADQCEAESGASSPIQDHTQSMPSYVYREEVSKSKKRAATVDPMDKIIDYLKSKKKKEQDAVDLLFMSYSTTFKSFSARTQANLKVTLAKAFSDAELSELDMKSNNG
ncbi:uncharacterized protein LOC114354444 [Ostrinia furnacalis]|uniref:uncharacterized protein LOC114354444 n=1 Tax=Ostrinia furnacalis TaxID=93504 RepID=UPI00103F2DFE|nr:uncharacterized protein LOC114354444 [Ostrinia furnacalis]